MIQKIKNKLLVAASMFLLAAPMAVPAVALAADPQIQGSLCKGAKTLQIDTKNAATQANCDDLDPNGAGEDKINKLINQVVNVFSIIVSIVAVIMIIYAGFRYITSGGATEKVTSAKNTILYAIIGLIIVALAQIVVKFVLNKTTTNV